MTKVYLHNKMLNKIKKKKKKKKRVQTFLAKKSFQKESAGKFFHTACLVIFIWISSKRNYHYFVKCPNLVYYYSHYVMAVVPSGLQPVFVEVSCLLANWILNLTQKFTNRYLKKVQQSQLRVGELHFCLLCPPCTALDHASSLSRKLAYVPGPTFGFVKLLASSGSHCPKWADEQHWPAGFESRLVPDLPSPLSPL